MYSYGKNNYNRRYDNENKYESSSLSSVYRDLISPNKEKPMISPYDSKKYHNNIFNNPTNYHFLNKNTNRSLNKSISPISQNYQYDNNISSNVSKNFFGSYGQERSNNDCYNQKQYNRNRSFDSKNNINRSTNNIFSYRNPPNDIKSINSFNRKNFYDTITNFEQKNYNKINKVENNLYDDNEKENYKSKYNYNIYNASTYNHNPYYKNYLNEKKNFDNNYSNNIRAKQGFYSKSLENNNLRSYDNKRNILSLKNNLDNNYNPFKSADFNISTNKLYRRSSQENIYNRNNYNNNLYKIINYSSSTMAGTNGYGITKTNQDSFIIKVDKNNNNENEYTFGIFDGHGSEGHLVSQAIKQFFMNCSCYDYSNNSMILSLFSALSRIINNSQYFDSINSGSTVVLIHITPDKIISINCGDSRAILITKNKIIIPLSRDHKPELPEEKQRIETSGGRVDKIFGMGPYRVWFKDEDYPGLAMSRSIGDKLAHKVGVSDIPEIKEYNICDFLPLAVIIASDGVWEFMSNEDVRNIVMNFAYSKDSNTCAKNIVEKSRLVWQATGYAIDDITCVAAFFND